MWSQSSELPESHFMKGSAALLAEPGTDGTKVDTKLFPKYRYIVDNWQSNVGPYVNLKTPLTQQQACDKYFPKALASNEIKSMSKASCPAFFKYCEDRWNDCGLTGIENHFKESAKRCEGSLNQGVPLFQGYAYLCAEIKQKWGADTKNAAICPFLKERAAEYNTCVCKGGVIADKGSLRPLVDPPVKILDGSDCCTKCATLKVEYNGNDVQCKTVMNKDLKDECSCTGVSQKFVIHGKEGNAAKKSCCALCTIGDWKEKVKEIKYKEDVWSCTGFACGDGKAVQISAKPGANPEIIKKQVCTQCTTDKVIINGADVDCKLTTEVPDIKVYPNPLAANGITNPQTFVANLIKVFLGIIGSLALGLVVYGGFVWMTAAGEPARIDSGRKTVLWAGIGLIAVFSSYVIVAFIFNSLG